MKSLYCEECGEYLMAGSGSLVDCSCGWKQPEDKGIDVAAYEALQAECEKLRKDAERIEWLEDQTKKSHTGISFDYHRYVEDGYVVDHGYRFMRRHFASGFKDSLRKAIDAAMETPDAP